MSPATSPYSVAVLSSALDRKSVPSLFPVCRGESCGIVHLLAAVDQSLLNRWNSFLLLDLFLDLRYLIQPSAPLHILLTNIGPYLVVRLNVQLNLLPGQCSDPVSAVSSGPGDEVGWSAYLINILAVPRVRVFSRECVWRFGQSCF